MATPVLALPTIVDQQADAVVQHNDALRALEVLIARKALDRDTSTPPGSPNDGDAYIVGPSATGDWAGHEDEIAYDNAGTWQFISPVEGMRLYMDDEAATVEYTGAAWVAVDGTQILTDAATIAWDASLGSQAEVTLGSNRTMGAPTNLIAGRYYLVVVKQDATGSRTLAWDAVFKWVGGTAPTLTTTASAVDMFYFYSPDGTNLYSVAERLDLS